MTASAYENFWRNSSFAVIGNNAKMPFPRFTYQGLKENRKTVYAVDPSASEMEGDKVYRDLASLPAPVDAVVLELPPEETLGWLEKAAAVGIRKAWIHWDTETPEALEGARARGMEVLTGTCAVMYLMPRKFPHNVHAWIRKLKGRY